MRNGHSAKLEFRSGMLRYVATYRYSTVNGLVSTNFEMTPVTENIEKIYLKEGVDKAVEYIYNDSAEYLETDLKDLVDIVQEHKQITKEEAEAVVGKKVILK